MKQNPYESPLTEPSEAPRFTLPETKRGCLGISLAVVGALLSGIFLANPTLGVFELLPDNLPIVGNLDEVFASALFFSCLSYLGINVLPFTKAGQRFLPRSPANERLTNDPRAIDERRPR